MDPSIIDALNMLSPDELQQAFAPYEYQLQMAEALRKPSGKQHTTGWGAALGGLADAVNNGMGAYQQKKTLEAMQGDMTARASALRNYQAAQQAQGAANQSAMGGYGNSVGDLGQLHQLLGAQQPGMQVNPGPWASGQMGSSGEPLDWAALLGGY